MVNFRPEAVIDMLCYEGNVEEGHGKGASIN
jgi:hypothetical protein